MFAVWILSACGWGNVSNLALEPQLGECYEGEGVLYPLEPGAWWRHDTVDAAEQDVCKLVWVESLEPIGLRPEVTAYKVHSLRVTEFGVTGYGVRWQEVIDCGLVRHVDEWYEVDMIEREAIKYYCPHRIRVEDCPGACEGDPVDPEQCDRVCKGATWMEDEWEVVVLKITASTASWDECETLAIDHQTCQPLQAITGCDWQISSGWKEWRIAGTYEPVTIDLGTYETLLTQQREKDANGDPMGWHSYWRARGVGKIKEIEEDGTLETLVEYCLPQDGCTTPPPSVEALLAECAAQ